MRYEVILEKGDYALIVRKQNLDEYAVVHYLDKENGCWGATHSYWNFGWNGNQTECLFWALDCFRRLTEKKYIPYSRMEEIASKSIDEFINAEPNESAYYFTNELDMDESELEFFGLNENGYRKDY